MSSDDFEWDANAAPPPTAWSTTATASRPARGRRAVYGSRSNRGPAKLYGRNRAGIGSSNASSSKSALVREESIGPLDELDEAGGGFVAAASMDAENSTSRHQRHPSDENIRNGSGFGRSNTSMNSTLDSSISSAGTAGAPAMTAAFDAGVPNTSAVSTSLEPP